MILPRLVLLAHACQIRHDESKIYAPVLKFYDLKNCQDLAVEYGLISTFIAACHMKNHSLQISQSQTSIGNVKMNTHH